MVTKKMTYLQLYLENVYFLVQTYNLDLKIIIWCDLDLFSKSNLCRSLVTLTIVTLYELFPLHQISVDANVQVDTAGMQKRRGEYDKTLDANHRLLCSWMECSHLTDEADPWLAFQETQGTRRAIMIS